MFKKSIIPIILTSALVLGVVTPALAQSNTSDSSTNLIGNLIQLLQKVLSQNKPQQNPSYVNQNNPPMMGNEATGGGQVNPRPGRLQTDKLTEAQKQSILSEVQKIRDEVNSWSKTTSLDPSYVYYGLRGPGMDPNTVPGGQNGGMGGSQGGSSNNQRMLPQGGATGPGGDGQQQVGGSTKPY